jgi:hypothetical protein
VFVVRIALILSDLKMVMEWNENLPRRPRAEMPSPKLEASWGF